MLRFAASAGAALLSVSNFFFWWESGYFDAISASKPLLHTWSLAVEEQFYLFWPALLFVLLLKMPRRAPVAVLAGLSIASVILGGILDPDRPGRCLLPAADADRRTWPRRRSWSGRCSSGPRPTQRSR